MRVTISGVPHSGVKFLAKLLSTEDSLIVPTQISDYLDIEPKEIPRQIFKNRLDSFHTSRMKLKSIVGEFTISQLPPFNFVEKLVFDNGRYGVTGFINTEAVWKIPADSFPDMKIVYLVRDIYSIPDCESEDWVSDLNVLLVEMQGQSSLDIPNYPDLEKNILVVKLEDLIVNTGDILYNLAQFLQLKKSSLVENFKSLYDEKKDTMGLQIQTDICKEARAMRNLLGYKSLI